MQTHPKKVRTISKLIATLFLMSLGDWLKIFRDYLDQDDAGQNFRRKNCAT
jgi:hypothetical protein